MITSEEYGLEMAKAAAEGIGRESVSKLADAIGGIFPFWGLKKKAVETYISDIENSNLAPEAKMVAIANAKRTYKQLKNQSSIAKIALEAAPAGTNFTESSTVEDEWLERFMDSAKFVSDETVQLLWGNILAKEFEHPNSTPPSVIRILSEMTPFYAKAFQVLCNLSVHFITVNQDGYSISSESFLILPTRYDYLSKYNLNFSTLNELQMLGLIQFEVLSGYVLRFDANVNPKLNLLYGENVATILKYPNKQFPAGCAMLTNAGRSIARFINPMIIDGHFEAVIQYLKDNHIEFSEKPEIRIIDNISNHPTDC